MDKLKARLKKLNLAAKEAAGVGGTKAFSGQGHRLGGGGDPKPAPRPAAAPPPPPATARPRPASPPPPAPAPAPPGAAQQPPPRPAPEGEPPEAVAAAVALLRSDAGAGAAAAAVLARLLANVADSPAEPKYRRVRLANPKISETVVAADGGVELLLAVGFELEFEGGGGADDAADAAAVLPAGADLAPLRHALHLLPSPPPGRAPPSPEKAALPPPAPPPAAPPAAAAREADYAAPCERRTRVVLPAPGDAAPLPDWFFQRTPSELRAAVAAALRRREAAQTLMTREMRERAARGTAASGAPPRRAPGAPARLRVRFPEGLALEGEFGPREPVAAVHAWVASALADPMHTFELVFNRRPLGLGAPGGDRSGGTVEGAGLAPSAALLLRWTGASAAAMRERPALRAELLRAAADGDTERG